MTLRDRLDYLWPTMEPWSDQELATIEKDEEADIAAVRVANWSMDIDVAIEESRRYFDSEEDRLKSAKEKATNFMLFVGALVPLLTYFAPAMFDKKAWSAPVIPSAIVFIISCLYLLGAGVWSFRALQVDTFQRVDVTDLLKIWSSAKPKEALVIEILNSTRRNRKPVNRIVGCIKMAHSFLKLAFVWLGILLLLEVGMNLLQLRSSGEESESKMKNSLAAERCAAMQPLQSQTLVVGKPGFCETPIGAAPFAVGRLLGASIPRQQ